MRGERRREDELLDELLSLLDWYESEYPDFDLFYDVLRDDIKYIFKEKNKLEILQNTLMHLDKEVM